MFDLKKAKTADRSRWFDIVTRDSGEFAALVAPFGNPAFRKLYDRLTAQHKSVKRKNDGELPAHIHDPIMKRCMAETILLDAKGIVVDGAEVPFSDDLAKQLVEIDEVFSGILQASLELSKTYAVEREESEGNSGNGSAGT